jgi:hypothetical protein
MLAGGIVGLVASGSIMALLWFGVSGVLKTHSVDLMYVFWPSSVMLVVGWHRTIPGIMITVSSVVINCMLYAALAIVLRALVRFVAATRP